MGGEILSQEKNWLVKSSSRILGPFTAVEIGQLLVKKHISLIDEVRQPAGRWGYIRENPVFSEIVQSLRSEQTNTIEVTVNTSPGTQTVTKTDVVPPNDVVTPTPEFKPAPPPYTGHLVKDITPTKDTVTPISAVSSRALEASFGAESDVRVQKKIEKKSRSLSFTLWILTLVLAGALGFLLFKKQKTGREDYKSFAEMALKYKYLQLYELALENYKKAQSYREADQQLNFEMALPLIQIEKQTLVARRALERRLNEPNISRKDIVESYLGIGLSFAVEGEIRSAQDYYTKALAIDPNNVAASLNTAISQIRSQAYEDAAKTLDSLPPSSTFGSPILLSRAILAAYYRKYLDTDLMHRLNEAISVPRPLRRELALASTYLTALGENHTGLSASMEYFIQLPVSEGENFIIQSYVDHRLFDWDTMGKLCRDIYSKASSNYLSKSFYATCLLEQGQDPDAKKLIDEAIVENPKSAYAKLAQAQYLFKNGNYQEAITILKDPELASMQIKYLIEGRACEALKDVICAKQAFEAGYKKYPDDVRYISEWARVNFSYGQATSLVFELIKRGLEIQPSYRPLIELRDRLESP